MRIYNGKKTALDLPLSGTTRIQVGPYSVSGDVLVSTDFLSLLVSSYDYSEVAIIVAGYHELSQCAQVPSAAGFVVQTLEEAIERFAPKEQEAVKEIIVPEEIKAIDEEVAEETKVEEESKPVVKKRTKKVVEKVKINTKKVEETAEGEGSAE